MNSQFVNTKQLSEMLGIPVAAVQRLVREGRIPAYKIDSKHYLFDPEEVIETIKSRRVN